MMQLRTAVIDELRSDWDAKFAKKTRWTDIDAKLGQNDGKEISVIF